MVWGASRSSSALFTKFVSSWGTPWESITNTCGHTRSMTSWAWRSWPFRVLRLKLAGCRSRAKASDPPSLTGCGPRALVGGLGGPWPLLDADVQAAVSSATVTKPTSAALDGRRERGTATTVLDPRVPRSGSLQPDGQGQGREGED